MNSYCGPADPTNWDLQEVVRSRGLEPTYKRMSYRYSSKIFKFSLKPGLYKIVLDHYFEKEDIIGDEYYVSDYVPVIYQDRSRENVFDYFALYDIEREQYRFLSTAVFSELFRDLWNTQADKVIEKTHGELARYLTEMDYQYILVGQVPVRTMVNAFMREVNLYPLAFMR